MDNANLPIMDAPATYRIRVHGRPSLDWIEAMLGDVLMTSEAAENDHSTTITVEMADQATLLGFINALYNMGHAVVSMEQVTPRAPDEPAVAA